MALWNGIDKNQTQNKKLVRKPMQMVSSKVVENAPKNDE